MTRLNGWKRAWAVFLLCAATVIVSPAQTFTTLASFDKFDGANPFAAVVQAIDGKFYGTTWGGGAYGYGTVFEITREGTLTTLHSFAHSSDGSRPVAPLVQGTDGRFYGTTYRGGPNRSGTFFEITPGGTLKSGRPFDGADGAGPTGGLIQATDGSFYGTTRYGGGGNWGTVFRITPGGMLTTLYTFCPQTRNCADGAVPEDLIQATDGNLYGTTIWGGDLTCNGHAGCGTIFQITSGGKLTTLYSFCAQANCADGSAPDGLVQATDGNFYGTTNVGGRGVCNVVQGCGTFFKITPAGELTTLYNFCLQANCPEGALPSGLIQGTDGNFYGVTFLGGICTRGSCGTVFRITPEGKLTTLHRFDLTHGKEPAGLIQATDGTFYGTSEYGGANGYGTVFSLSVGLGPFVAFVRPAGKVGETGDILGQGFTGTTSVSLNGTPANFKVVSDTFISATVPVGATSGYVTVTTPSGTLTSNKPFQVMP